MILRVINHPYEFDMKNLCITFFPHEKIRLEGEEDPVVVTTRRETDGSFFVSAKVYDVYRETTAKPEPADEEHLVLSVALYRLLSGILGFAPPWGVLYGVRPAKLMHRLCAQMGDDAAVAHFQTAFLTQKSKAELAHEVMLHENRSIARSGPKSFSLYVSIPFCPTRCAYCSFVSHSIEKTHKLMTPYVDLLLRELEETAKYAKELGLELATVYFGGGTPSLLSPAQVGRLIRAACPVSGAEVTLEANPETVTEESLRGFREAGVNRISFGVQSARDTQLRTLGRPHTARQARAAFAAARRAGFENISGDIMLALPHYTQAEFDETLELIEEGGATHISAYLLKIEPDSAFGRTPPEGLPTGDEAADFYLYAVEQLEHHGYRQYEISNFAKPGYEGRHNLIYWDCGDYLGLGPAAHSCMGGKRFYYPADTAAFLQDNAAPVMDGGCGAEDYLILQLRLRKGLSLPQYKALYGKEFSPVQLAFIRNCVKNGYAAFDGTTLALTPAGLIVQNSILAELL